MKTYFFSPIGGNDPVSSSTESDGSMLHICRHYKPDEVYLYLSKGMIERHRKDDRYQYCIKKLGEKLGHTFLVQCIEDDGNSEVQEYDYYYNAFEPWLQKIKSQMKDGDRLILNISSGTPAMKSALVLLSAMSEIKLLPVQVITPAKSINCHPGKEPDYDAEVYWELNKDNEEGAPNRCREPQMLNLAYRLKRQNLEKCIMNYDYAAALLLGKEMKDDLPEGAFRLLEYAVARLQLDLVKMKRMLPTIPKEDREQLCPLWQPNGGDDEPLAIFEYVLSLKIKIENKEYGDFARAISPVLTDLFEGLLKDQCGVSIAPYIGLNQSGVRVWDTDKMEKDEQGKQWISLMGAKFNGKFNHKTPVAASNLVDLLLYYLKDEKLKSGVKELRSIEGAMRNLAAHEIVSITDDNLGNYIKDVPNITISYIYKEIRYIAQIVLKIKGELWDSYDAMNELICRKIRDNET